MIVFLIELAESKALSARLKADEVALLAAARVSDLDQEETPESIMLSSMTEEGAKDRTDREVVVPWLKFLWEIYRAILELLYKIPKLEKIYHKTCEKAFKFCLDFKRVLEFKKLCEMLRLQLASLQKAPPVGARIRTAWEWTPEAVEYHLNTRFALLEVAIALELWNEGFRTVEDIYAIMVAGKKTPKPKLMMTYYDKLQRIFWVSDNKLFHAYAWFRYYCLCCDSRKDLKAEEKSILASSVLLSALTVPSTRDIYSFTDDEEEVVEKSSQMALLLDFQTNPSRQTLLSDISATGVLSDVLPELLALYENLEVKFQPLALVQKIISAVAVVKSNPALAMYAIPLQRVAVVKLMQQLGRVYSTIKLEFLYKLLSGLSDLTPTVIERILIEGVAAKQLQLKVYHVSSSIKFGNQSTSASAFDNQVSQLGSNLNKIAYNIANILDTTETIKKSNTVDRSLFLSKVAKASESDYAESLDRKAQIEKRKEEQERQKELKLQEEIIRLEHEEIHRQKEEALRLENEEKQRLLEKQRRDKEKIEVVRVKKELERLGVLMEESAIAELDNIARRSLIADAQNEALKAKEDENRKLVEQAKRLDHITRALRIEAGKSIEQRYQKQVEEDKVIYNQKLAELEVRYKDKHVEDLIEKSRLTRLQSLRDGFEKDIIASQKIEYERKIAKLKEEAKKNRLENIIAKARRLYNEEQDRIYAEEEKERERLAKEERARQELLEYERLRVERERREQKEKEDEEIKERMLKQIAAAEEAERIKKEEERIKKEEERKSQVPVKEAYVPPSARVIHTAEKTESSDSWGRERFSNTRGSGGGGGDSMKGSSSRYADNNATNWRSDKQDSAPVRESRGQSSSKTSANVDGTGSSTWRGSSGKERGNKEVTKDITKESKVEGTGDS